MSTLVLTNDSLVFGPQNPFYRTETEVGLKEAFLRLLTDKNSQVIRKRSFATYVLANQIFPNSTISVSEYVKYGIGQLLDPFLGFTIKNSIDSVLNVKRNLYAQGEVAFTNELAKATKIKNTLVMIADSTKDTYSEQKGITTYITRSFKTSEDSLLDATWANNFFTFNDTSSLCLLVVIPKSYIANLMINIQASDSKEINTAASINKIVFRSILVDAFVVDLIKSFFTAIYSDGYRNRINRDICSLNTLFQKEGANIFTGAYKEDSHGDVSDSLKQYCTTLKGFKSNDCENLIYEMLKFIQYKTSAEINPLDFYTSLIDIPYAQMEVMFKRMPAFARLTESSVSLNNFDFSNSLSGMNRFFIDSDRDVVIYGLKLVRYLPFLIFNTYVIGGGTGHGKLLNVLSNVKSIVGSINSFRSKSAIYAPLCSFIVSEIEYICGTLASQLGSPMAVNDKSRGALTSTIIKINRLNQAIVNKPDTPEFVKTSSIEDELNAIAEKGDTDAQ